MKFWAKVYNQFLIVLGAVSLTYVSILLLVLEIDFVQEITDNNIKTAIIVTVVNVFLGVLTTQTIIHFKSKRNK